MCAIIQMEWLSASFTVLVYFLQQSLGLNGRKRESRLKAREPLGTSQVGGKPRAAAVVDSHNVRKLRGAAEGTGNPFSKSDRVERAVLPCLSYGPIPELKSSSRHEVAACLVRLNCFSVTYLIFTRSPRISACRIPRYGRGNRGTEWLHTSLG